jgi:hypothetical protein
MAHTHTWVSLQGEYIDVYKEATNSEGVRSLFRIVGVCKDKTCFAGITGDDVIIDDVRVGTIAGEGVRTVTMRLERRGKERP